MIQTAQLTLGLNWPLCDPNSVTEAGPQLTLLEVLIQTASLMRGPDLLVIWKASLTQAPTDLLDVYIIVLMYKMSCSGLKVEAVK